MQRHLNLVTANQTHEENRVLPRFPFSSLTFKASCCDTMTFQVSDISFSGMRISLKNGTHVLKEQSIIEGFLHWHGKEAHVSCEVIWVKENNVGLKFKDEDAVKDFLTLETMIRGLRPLHLHTLGIEKPQNLKYWLKAASAMELFVWTHADGEFEKFQLIFVDQFVEWQDGKGLQTGTLKSRVDLDTPLVQKDEMTFSMDEMPDPEKLVTAKDLVEHIPNEKLDQETVAFILRKLAK